MKKHGNNNIILTFLQSVYKSPKMLNPYAKLTKNTMWEWFTKEGELKENYMEATQHGTIVKSPKWNLLELEKYHELRDEMVHVLQKMRKVVQPLSTWIVQPIFKGIIIFYSSTH
jgi:hypothetical protein